MNFLQVVESHENYLGHSGRSTSFVTSFKIILKLVDFFRSCGQSKKYLRLSGRSTSFATSFKIILKPVEFCTSCGQSKKGPGHFSEVVEA